MALSYSNAQFIGEPFRDIFKEIMLQNTTIDKGLVTVDINVKGNRPYTEVQAEAGIKARVASPTSSDKGGSVTFTDLLATPKYLMDYDEFDPVDYAVSRFNRDAMPGAINAIGNEFIQNVLMARAPKISTGMEALFWSGATSASKTAVAALTAGTGQNAVGAAEKTKFAALTTTLFDGVVARLIQTYSNGATRRRWKVAGTTIDASNIFDEYAKVYAAINSAYLGSALLLPVNRPNVKIFAPYSHIALIETYNLNQTYRDKFVVSTDRTSYSFSGIEIEFVPLPENTMILFNGKNAVWASDTTADLNQIKIDWLAANSTEMFLRADFTADCVVMQPGQAVLYVG